MWLDAFSFRDLPQGSCGLLSNGGLGGQAAVSAPHSQGRLEGISHPVTQADPAGDRPALQSAAPPGDQAVEWRWLRPQPCMAGPRRVNVSQAPSPWEVCPLCPQNVPGILDSLLAWRSLNAESLLQAVLELSWPETPLKRE